MLKFEPFILHVQCRRLEDAQLLVRIALIGLTFVLGKKHELHSGSYQIPLKNVKVNYLTVPYFKENFCGKSKIQTPRK